MDSVAVRACVRRSVGTLTAHVELEVVSMDECAAHRSDLARSVQEEEERRKRVLDDLSKTAGGLF